VAAIVGGRFALAIVLPLGSEPGAYAIRVLRNECVSSEVASMNDMASIEDGLTIFTFQRIYPKLGPVLTYRPFDPIRAHAGIIDLLF
jgi:hypothetical protein